MGLIITLVILGVVFYFIEQIPMVAPMPNIIRAVLVIVAIVLVLQWLGVNTGLPTFQVR